MEATLAMQNRARTAAIMYVAGFDISHLDQIAQHVGAFREGDLTQLPKHIANIGNILPAVGATTDLLSNGHMRSPAIDWCK